jgi:hypothetical protein
MKLFERTGGYWLFWCGVFYVLAILLVAFTPYRDYTILLQTAWMFTIALPLMCNPLARWLNMKETHMFNWFKKDELPSNVVPFPDPKDTPKMPYVVPPEPKKEPKTYYTFGLTDDNRVSFTMGYTTLTMNTGGVDQLITQLEFFKNQLQSKEIE